MSHPGCTHYQTRQTSHHKGIIMKYLICHSFLLLSCHGLWAMEAVLPDSKGKQDLTSSLVLPPKTVLEGDDDDVHVNPVSNGTLESLFPPGEEDLPLFQANAAPEEAADDQEGGSLFDTLFSAKAKIDEIKKLPADEQATRTKELEDAVEVLLRKRAENAHTGQKLSQQQLDARRRKDEAIAVSQQVDKSVELNASERKLLGEVARSLAEVLPQHRQADIEEVLRDMTQEESVGFWRWATSWMPKMRCIIQ